MASDETACDPRESLTAQEMFVIEHALAGKEMGEISTLTGISRSTVWRILKRPHVDAFIAESIRDTTAAVRRRLARHACKAVDALYDIGMDETQPGQVRVSALARVATLAVPARQEVTGAGGGPISVSVEDARELIRSELRGVDDGTLGIPDYIDVDEE